MSVPYTWIYLIHDPFTDLYKIGKSDDPQARLRSLTHSPTIPAAPNSYILIEAWLVPEKTERELHEEYADERVRGEWFNLPNAVQELTESFCEYPRFLRPGTMIEEAAMKRAGIDRKVFVGTNENYVRRNHAECR